MNSLSWLIYVAQCVSTLRTFLLSTMIILFMMNVAGTIAALVSKFDPCGRGVFFEWWKSFPKVTIPILALLAVLFTVLPDRTTMILIAGSEIGEKVMTSEKAKGVVDPSLELLRTWISKETLKLKKGIQEEK